MNVTSPRIVARLTDPSLTAALSHFVRGRVPDTEVADIVQATLADALDAPHAPETDEDIVRWVYGICRHKIVDRFRRMRREVPRDLQGGDDAAPAESAPTSAMELMRWARRELPPGKENEQTLEWMLREGEGEKLETIAAEAKLPAPRVRQRVSRLRRYYKARWAEALALAALVLVALAIGFALRRKQDVVAPRPEPVLPSAVPSAPPAPPPAMPALSTQPAPAPSDSTDALAPAPPASVPSKPIATPAPDSTVAPRKPQGRKPSKWGSGSTSGPLPPPANTFMDSIPGPPEPKPASPAGSSGPSSAAPLGSSFPSQSSK